MGFRVSWMLMKLGLLVIAGCVLGALGCGGGAAPGSTGGAGTGGGAAGTGGGTPTTAVAFCQQVESAFAASSARCYGGTAADWNVLPEFCTGLAKLTTTIQFNASMATDCLATVTAKTAAECSPDVPCIDQVVRGLVQNGKPCTHGAECAPNARCVSPDDTTCAQSVCAAPSPVGGSCFPSCDDKGVCDVNTNRCVAIVEVDVGGTCGDKVNHLCKSGLTCLYDPGQSAAGVCQAKPPGCGFDFDCDVLLEFCDLSTKACKPRIKLGASCTNNATGCVISATCDPVTHRCAKAGHPGETCASDFNICFKSYCDVTSGSKPICGDFKPAGAPCTAGIECTSGVCSNRVCTDCPR
jgi:hypothetical protein